MNPDWQKALEGSGASIESGIAVNFGDAAAELRAADSGSVLADASHLAVLDFSGEDSTSFLQGQLTCDVNTLAIGSSAYGGYCSAAGRLLADFLLWHTPSEYRMVLARSIAGTTRKRLAQFVLRAKVNILDRSDELVVLGAAGHEAGAVLGAVFGDIPRQDHRVLQDEFGGSLIALPAARFLIVAAPTDALRIQAGLTGALRPVGAPCWEWLDIRNGFPWIAERTQDQFVPQMANLELLGGVSFQKGCYPGQEIVARTQYRGKLKRRMFLANVEAQVGPVAGDELFSDDLPGQTCGMVVNAQRSPSGGYDLLAVVPLESRASSILHLKSTDGPVLRFLELPYQVA
ncbi:MAG: folate-binding protein YgfZ [Betaproteobacteria bacterium]|nr:folate-binding protein YgfZ [Betaproteobacteria bacterium]